MKIKLIRVALAIGIGLTGIAAVACEAQRPVCYGEYDED